MNEKKPLTSMHVPFTYAPPNEASDPPPPVDFTTPVREEARQQLEGMKADAVRRAVNKILGSGEMDRIARLIVTEVITSLAGEYLETLDMETRVRQRVDALFEETVEREARRILDEHVSAIRRKLT